jgi:hypothetical protein
MKFGFTLAACLVVMFSVTAPSIVEAANYASICKSARLKSSERKECRARMKAAESKGERAQIFKEFDLRTIGLGPDGKPLKK